MSARNDEYFLLCITDSKDAIVGTGALIVERKFIHQLGLVGHIEDIAVAKDQQGKKLGLRIIQALDFVAEKVGCYKVREAMKGEVLGRDLDLDLGNCGVGGRC
jgi:GNAT superfamily N-acetyltransferase